MLFIFKSSSPHSQLPSWTLSQFEHALHVHDKGCSLEHRLVHFHQTLLLLAGSQEGLLPNVAFLMGQELVERVVCIGKESAPYSFALAMSTAVDRCRLSDTDAPFGELIAMLMRYFAQLFGTEIGASLQAQFMSE